MYLTPMSKYTGDIHSAFWRHMFVQGIRQLYALSMSLYPPEENKAPACRKERQAGAGVLGTV